MSDASKKSCSTVRRQRSIYQVHYALKKQEEMSAKPFSMPFDPLEVQTYDLQVAGHKSSEGKQYFGLLQCNNGTILKPILKESQKREVDFYNTLMTATHADLVELRKLIPKYFGCSKFTYNGFEQDYIMLEDLTQRMLEPCIMDIKIGKRTWDPLASEEKRKNEETKYALCKQQYGFCIPGFQVYKLATGKLHKYSKDYGKRLHGHMVKEAIKNFLNGGNGGSGRLCRPLVLQLLSALWRVQKWARAQTRLRLYSASLLLVYDAHRLRVATAPQSSPFQSQKSSDLPRRSSIHSLHSLHNSPTPPAKPLHSVPIVSQSSPWSQALEKLNQNHSFEHDYEDKLGKIRMNYRAMLDQLSSDSPDPNPWGAVKVIDFAHAFFAPDDDKGIDDNFREGIDHFVDIFEDFLKQTDDQVF